ncbi:MAG TPA: class I SAM-dependent methyltransferase [Burkholderiales bacterium]
MKQAAVEARESIKRCRFCGSGALSTFVDLGMSPLANSYVEPEALGSMEPFYPLHAYVCEKCFLVQLMELESSERIFSQYAYFSSYSRSWLEHARAYVRMIVPRLRLDRSSRVVEIASNDGYLLQYMKEAGVEVLGIEPARNVAAAAIERGIPTITRFFGAELARELAAEGRRADLLLGNNVLAHVPDLNDFVAGMKLLLAPGGTITMEFPHLLRLIEQCQFDTIYHEHFSYFWLGTVERVFAHHGLTLYDVEELPTHGGSLRIYARHAEDRTPAVEPRVARMRALERRAGAEDLELYAAFGRRVAATKRRILRFLIDARDAGRRVAAYGAPAKGNTLLNYCGIGTDLIEYTVDASPHKQGRYLPGTRLPIHAPAHIAATRPDYVVILPWNLKQEIMEQMAHIRDWGGRFVTFVPDVEVSA